MPTKKKSHGHHKRLIGEPLDFAKPQAKEYAAMCCILLILVIAALGLTFAIINFVRVNELRRLWERDGDDHIGSKTGPVHVRDTLIVDENMEIDGAIVFTSTPATGLEKIFHTPVIVGPPGDDIVMGDQSIPYSRVQARDAIGFRLGSSPTGPSPGIFGEPDLKVLIQPFGVQISSFLSPFFGIFIPSDERIKNNVTNLNTTTCLGNLLNLDPVQYFLNEGWATEGGVDASVPQTGFLAQNVKDTLLNSVRETELFVDGEVIDDFLQYNINDLFPEVIGSIKEMNNNVQINILRSYCLDPFGGAIIGLPAYTDDFCACTSSGTPVSCACAELVTLCISQGSNSICSASDPFNSVCTLLSA